MTVRTRGRLQGTTRRHGGLAAGSAMNVFTGTLLTLRRRSASVSIRLLGVSGNRTEGARPRFPTSAAEARCPSVHRRPDCVEARAAHPPVRRRPTTRRSCRLVTMIRAVVFDLGGVLASGEGVISEPAKLLGVDAERFEELYWAGRDAYDAGASDSEYWKPILQGLGKPAALETVQQLARMDAEAWLRIRPEARRLVADVRATGRTTAVLSNAPFNIDNALLDSDFADDVDFWFISAAMGVRKPDQGTYLRVGEVLELEPHEIFFVDDRPDNVAGAERAGWVAHLWSSDGATRGWLEQIGVLHP